MGGVKIMSFCVVISRTVFSWKCVEDAPGASQGSIDSVAPAGSRKVKFAPLLNFQYESDTKLELAYSKHSQWGHNN